MLSRRSKYTALLGIFLTGFFITDLQAAIKYGPRITQVTTDSAVITWFTNTETVENKVVWGAELPLVNEQAEDETSYNASLRLWKHVARLGGLSTRTEYTYKVVSDGDESPVYDFLTAVEPGQPFKFGLVSDLHTVTNIGARQLEHGIQNGIDFWVHAGDTVHEGEDPTDWDTYFALYNQFPNPYGISKNFWASHAVYDTFAAHSAGYPPPYEGLEPYLFFYTVPKNGLPKNSGLYKPNLYRQEFTYAFGYGNVYFISLAAEKDVTGVDYGDQVAWLEQQLQNSVDQGYDFRIVYSHRMGYTNAGVAEESFHRHIQPLLEKYKVAMHFGGHYHSYNRCTKNGVSHVTIGTGGGSRADSDENERPENEAKYGCWVDKLFGGFAHAEVSVSGDTMTMNVIGTDEPRKVIDTVTWKSSPVSTPEPAMVHQWKLDEDGGTDALDSVGDLDGTLLNGTSFGAGRVGSGIILDGIDDRVEIPRLDPPSTGTLEFWVNPAAPSTTTERIIGGIDSFEVRRLPDGRLAADIFQGGSAVLTSTTAPSHGAWHHVAITWDLNSSTEIYVDGKLDASGKYASVDPGVFTLSLGTRTGRSDYFAGSLDEVAIHNYQLSAAEIEDHFNDPGNENIDPCADPSAPAQDNDAVFGIANAGPIGGSGALHRWTLDEAAGTLASDSVGQLDGELLNGTAWFEGALGSGIFLDGFDDKVEIPGVEPPNAGTLEFWVQVDGIPASYQRILGGADNFEVRLLSTGRLAADIFQGGAAVLKSTSVLTPGTWHHVVITWNANSSTEIYLDGKMDASGVFASSPPGTITFSLGTRTGRSEYFAGGLDEVAIYNYQLSASEVLDRYNAIAGSECQ